MSHASDSDLILKDEVYEIVSCAFEVMNEIGHGFREKTYERALAREFALRKIDYEQQREFPVFYKETQIDTFIPDLIVFGKIVVDTKTIDQIAVPELGQMLNYLRITSGPVGLIINFKNPKIEWRRVILEGIDLESHSSSFASIRGSQT